MTDQPRKAQPFELDTLMDLIRLVISNSGNRSGYLYYGQHNDQPLFAVSHLVPSWYEMRGLPVTLFARTDTPPDENIIAYKFATETEEENWSYVKHVTTDPNTIYIPLIKVKEFPTFFI
ncbi:MAG: hypothetical protein IH840_03945 [Candidatus Heimdallarchaeota archaeon]|nr:hypothetical protein [Candidatus Heimdallarchaeota archaeon]